MIRLRLITLAALAVVSGALSAGASGITPILTFLFLAVLGIVYAAQTRHLRLNLIRVTIALSLFWAGFAMTGNMLGSSAPGQLPVGTSAVTGTSVTSSATQSTGATSLEMSVSTADETPLKRPVTITVQIPDRRSSYPAGQPLRVLGQIAALSPPLNPGEQRLGPSQMEIFLARDIHILPGNSVVSWWGRLTKRVRDLVELRARPLLDYRAFGFLEELLLHRKLFELADRQVFSMTGTSHLLAISGLHLSLIFALMSALFDLMFSENSIGRTVAPLAATFVYLAFIDFPLSADRAFIMLSVLTATRLLGGHLSKLASLSWAALIITLVDPVSVFDIGLQLSFASVAGLFFIGEPLAHLFRPRRRLTRGLVSSLSATIGASLPTAALVMLTFHIVAPVALIANVIAIPAVSLLLPGLLTWSAVLLLVRPVAILLAPIINGASAILVDCLQLLSRLPGSHHNVSAPRPLLLASLALFFGVLILTMDNWTRLRRLRYSTIPVAVAAILVLLAWSFGTAPFDTRITFPVVDQGNIVLVQSRTMGTWLCLFDTNAKAGDRAVHAVAALGINTPDVVVVAGSPTDLPDQLDSLFGLLSPRHVYVPAIYASIPIAGLPPRFESIVSPLGTGKMVSIVLRDGSIRAGNTNGSGPSLLVVTAALVGEANAAASPLSADVPNFAYDTSAGIVRVLTAASTSTFSLKETGCVSIFTRGSRCWVASDQRR